MIELWHVSEDPTIEVFVPHHRELHAIDESLVWAVDPRFLWLYWFPRDCPRVCWCANERTTEEDVERWLDGDRDRRVAVIEAGWLDRMRAATLYAYRLPAESFEPWDTFFISRETVVPLERVELGDLLALHADARIELRIEPGLSALWDEVVSSTLDYSGIRLRNATMA